jgi:hypothetical protein
MDKAAIQLCALMSVIAARRMLARKRTLLLIGLDDGFWDLFAIPELNIGRLPMLNATGPVPSQ